MEKKINIQEIAVVIVAKSNNPSILNPDFLKHNNIVPKGWELSENPIATEPLSQVKFKNNISIIAQFEKLIFSEAVGGKAVKKYLAPNIAKKYIQVLPHVDYTAVGINIKGHVIADTPAEAENYAINTLVAEGAWKNFFKVQTIALPKFIYALPDGRLTINVENAFLPSEDESLVPVVTFGSNMHREIGGSNTDELIKNISIVLDGYSKDVESYTSLINAGFLN